MIKGNQLGWGCCLLAVLLGTAGCRREQTLTRLEGKTMGTTWSLQLVSPPADLHANVQNHLDQLEAAFSHWRPDSAVSRFNDSQSTDWFAVPQQVVDAVRAAKRISEDTNGALDITMGPLMDLWGFGARSADFEPKVPSDEAIAEAKSHSGWMHLEWRVKPPALKKKKPDLRLNLAAVTEGLAVDEVTRALRGVAINNFVLEIGGEIMAAGLAPGGKMWQVGVQVPGAPSNQTMQTLPLRSHSISTSGNYRQGFQVGGKRYSHVIDPRTGRPVEHRLASVSVIHEKCVLADGYATALMVLGPVHGPVEARRLGLRAFFVEEE